MGVQPWRSEMVFAGTLIESTSNGDGTCEADASCSADERRDEWEAFCIEFACLLVAREC